MHGHEEIHSLVKEGGIAVLDFGGQYAHLIASRLRRLGAYSEILQPDEIGESLDPFFKGIIYSGGPSSVYDAGAPTASEALLALGLPVLGICYGHQLIMQQLGGEVARGQVREYGPARLHLLPGGAIFQAVPDRSMVWMSHGDEVIRLPVGFTRIGSTDSCENTAVFHAERNIYGIQFHPEVTHSTYGEQMLRNFIAVCGLTDTWKIEDYVEFERRKIRRSLKDKKVFFLVSGGVDSTVAFALLGKEMDRSHLVGMLVDTGFLREREAEKVRASLQAIGVDLRVRDAKEDFYKALSGVSEPEKKRRIIGELFVDVQQQVSREMGLNEDEWLLGQGTIYPDTIESGATKSSHTIKTHHNRVNRIQELIARGLVIEPLRDLYKDEVRSLGRIIGLPDVLVDRHPFPGPGLAVRCLCTAADESGVSTDFSELAGEAELFSRVQGMQLAVSVLPLRSVGVQGDQRSYAHPALFDTASLSDLLAKPGAWADLLELAARIPGKFSHVNRVLLRTGRHAQAGNVNHLLAGRFLTEERIAKLQRADAIVDEFLHEKKIYSEIWQMPVVLVPLSSDSEIGREGVVLRPICSTDAMTASAYEMDAALLYELTGRLLATDLFDSVYYDLTSKPPGTIEWE